MKCECEKPGWCSVLGRCSNGRVFQICHGLSRLSEEEAEAYRQFWIANLSGQNEMDCVPMPVMLDEQEQQKAKPQPPCAHLGPDTGLMVECPTCSGKVSLKVFACEVHGACTVAKKVERRACCIGCDKYQAA